MRVLSGLAELRAAEGEELGVSEWIEVTQQEVDAFADATGDHQWIHVDVQRARSGPFGGTVAHGFYTLSVAPRLSQTIYRFEGFAMGINYGLNRVRFISPVLVGSRLRLRAMLRAVEDRGDGVQLTLDWTLECDGSEKPACAAEMLVRLQ